MIVKHQWINDCHTPVILQLVEDKMMIKKKKKKMLTRCLKRFSLELFFKLLSLFWYTLDDIEYTILLILTWYSEIFFKIDHYRLLISTC